MNGNSNGLTQLKRMEMEFKGTSYVFDLNPERYEMSYPNRVNLMYTKNSAFIDLFGEGVRELSVSGITGFKGQTKDKEHGFKKIQALKKLIRDNYKNVQDGKEIKDYLMFYNHTDGEGYVTVPIKFDVLRNVNQPLMYKYDLSFYVLRNAGDPEPQRALQTIGGNKKAPKTENQTIEERDVVEKDLEGSNFSNTNLQRFMKNSSGSMHMDNNGDLKKSNRFMYSSSGSVAMNMKTKKSKSLSSLIAKQKLSTAKLTK